jgi:hypothetical protein
MQLDGLILTLHNGIETAGTSRLQMYPGDYKRTLEVTTVLIIKLDCIRRKAILAINRGGL